MSRVEVLFLEGCNRRGPREEFNAVHARLANVDGFDKLQSAVDDYMKLGETYYQEMMALGSKVDRLERWLRQVNDKLGMKLEY